MRYFRLFIALFAIMALAIPAVASANSKGDWNSDRLNQIATDISGKSAGVYCENSWAEWVDVSRALGGSGDGLMGFTFTPDTADPFGNTNAVYLNPESCTAFHLYESGGWGTTVGAHDAGLFWLADAVISLTHESIHVSGISDEGQTQCNAITALRNGLLTTEYGIPKKVSSWAYKTVRTKHGTKAVKVRVMTANPVYTRMIAWINAIHASDDPVYKAVC